MAIIEPKPFEIDIIYSIIDEIEDGRDPAIIAAALTDLMRQTAFIEPGDDPEILLQEAAEAAQNTFELITSALSLYSGRTNNLNGASREDLLAEFIGSKRSFKRRTGIDYENVPALERADMHLVCCNRFVDILIEHYVSRATDAEAGPRKGGNKKVCTSDDIAVPLDKHPWMIGLVYAHHVAMGLLIEHMGLLLAKTEQEARQAREHVMAGMKEGLKGSRTPGFS